MEKEYTVIALLRILKKRVLLIVCASVVLGIVSFFCMSRWNDTHNQYVATTYFAVAHADKKIMIQSNTKHKCMRNNTM
ncbi:hypothetical protein ab3b_02273 [Weissella cibaria]|uniref:Uncharacterized protein n=1 Tax=Weissella cibaria TaxID=137591 RepID=A0A0D1K566_9LACO|nr:hypothetical protein ab3b_02273 [Weissella cibaria]